MKTYNLKPELTLTSEEIDQYNSLPANMPDTKLKAKEKEFIDSLYYRYISKTIDNKDWSKEMYKVEQAEKWPSGSRVKEHEAKRMILSNLVFLNTRPVMTMEEAASMFKTCLTLRPMYAKLVANAYAAK